MFGSSKATNGPATLGNNGTMTGLERAKLERSQVADVPLPHQPDDSLRSPVERLVLADAARNAAVKRPAAPDLAKPDPNTAAHLYVGQSIKLKGEIIGCDVMRIEGSFDGSASARQLILCPGSAYLGSADVDDAEIEGSFDGTLHVRGRLLVRNKGRVAGNLSYGTLEIERGGEIDGQITPYEKRRAEKAALAPSVAVPPPAPRPAIQPASAGVAPRLPPAAAVHAAAPQPARPPAAPAPRPAVQPAMTAAG